MTISKALEEIQTVFLDTAPVIYFIEAHHRFGPLVKKVVELMNENRIQAFTSVLTLSEVLPKPVETKNDALIEKFKAYLKNGQNLTLLPITEIIGESRVFFGENIRILKQWTLFRLLQHWTWERTPF